MIGTWLCVARCQFCAKMTNAEPVCHADCRTQKTKQSDTRKIHSSRVTAVAAASLHIQPTNLILLCFTWRSSAAEFSTVSVPHFFHLNSCLLFGVHDMNSAVECFYSLVRPLPFWVLACRFRLEIWRWTPTQNRYGFSNCNCDELHVCEPEISFDAWWLDSFQDFEMKCKNEKRETDRSHMKSRWRKRGVQTLTFAPTSKSNWNDTRRCTHWNDFEYSFDLCATGFARKHVNWEENKRSISVLLTAHLVGSRTNAFIGIRFGYPMWFGADVWTCQRRVRHLAAKCDFHEKRANNSDSMRGQTNTASKLMENIKGTSRGHFVETRKMVVLRR